MIDTLTAAVRKASADRALELVDDLYDEILEQINELAPVSCREDVDAWVSSLDDDAVTDLISRVVYWIVDRRSDLTGEDGEFYRVLAKFGIASHVITMLEVCFDVVPGTRAKNGQVVEPRLVPNEVTAPA